MPLINCELTGDYDAAGTRCSFFLSLPVTLHKVNEMFPFEGSFHFRVQVPGKYAGVDTDHLWLDFTKDNEGEIQHFMSADSVNLQALILALPDDYVGDGDFDEYLNEVDNAISATERQDRLPVDDKSKKKSLKHAAAAKGKEILKSISHGVKASAQSVTNNSQNITLESVAKGASSFWSAVKQTASQLQSTLSNNQPLSDISEENLAQLSEAVSVTFSDSNPAHVAALSDLWCSLFPEQGKYQRHSPVWKEAGFQKPDPAVDLKASGLLALQSMTYLAHNYEDRSKRMLDDNRANTKGRYPFAIVGINITLLLAEVLNLRDQK
jgi:hypothetical protein